MRIDDTEEELMMLMILAKYNATERRETKTNKGVKSNMTDEETAN